MKPNSSAPSYLLYVFPRGGRLPKGIPVELNPIRGELVKNDPNTLIWRGVLVDGRQATFKLYKRGLAVWGRSLATGFRVQREFDGLSQLETLGIPCGVPLFWGHGHFGRHGWGEILVTEWVVQSQSLRDLLVTRSEVSRSMDFSPLFADIARMHALGLHHGTLRTRNILVKNYPERPIFVFIDMPRFHRFPRDIRGTRMAHYDLAFLCKGLLPYFSEDTALSWLSAYGIPESAKTELLVRLKRFRSTALLRRVLGAEFNVRIAMAQFLKFSPRNAPESQPYTGSGASYE